MQKVCEKLRYDRNQNRCGQCFYGTYSLMGKRDNECVHTDRVWVQALCSQPYNGEEVAL